MALWQFYRRILSSKLGSLSPTTFTQLGCRLSTIFNLCHQLHVFYALARSRFNWQNSLFFCWLNRKLCYTASTTHRICSKQSFWNVGAHQCLYLVTYSISFESSIYRPKRYKFIQNLISSISLTDPHFLGVTPEYVSSSLLWWEWLDTGACQLIYFATTQPTF